MNKFFSNAVEKIKNWPVSQKVYASLWLITAIFLIVVIVLLVVWQTTSLATDASGKLLTPDALYQQNVIAGLTFTTVILLAISIFTTAISCYYKKKKGLKNANPKI